MRCCNELISSMSLLNRMVSDRVLYRRPKGSAIAVACPINSSQQYFSLTPRKRSFAGTFSGASTDRTKRSYAAFV